MIFFFKDDLKTVEEVWDTDFLYMDNQFQI